MGRYENRALIAVVDDRIDPPQEPRRYYVRTLFPTLLNHDIDSIDEIGAALWKGGVLGASDGSRFTKL